MFLRGNPSPEVTAKYGFVGADAHIGPFFVFAEVFSILYCLLPSSVSASRCHLPPRGKALVRFFDHTAYQRDVEDAVPYKAGA